MERRGEGGGRDRANGGKSALINSLQIMADDTGKCESGRFDIDHYSICSGWNF